MSITEHKHVSELGSGRERRLEIFTGMGRRRSWSTDEKAAIVAESRDGSASVCSVARRHGLTPSQLFAWRRASRSSLDAPGTNTFVEAIVASASRHDELHPECPSMSGSGIIEVEIDGAVVRIGKGAERETITAVLHALKGLS